MNQQRVVLASLVVIGLLVGVDDIAKGKVPGIRTFTAVIMLWVLLAIIGDFDPDLAKAMAVLIAMAVLVARGPRVFALIGKVGR